METIKYLNRNKIYEYNSKCLKILNIINISMENKLKQINLGIFI